MQTVFPGFLVFFIFLTNYSDAVKFPLPQKIKSIQQVFTVLRARLLSVVMVTIIWLPTLIHALDVKEKKRDFLLLLLILSRNVISVIYFC